MVAMASQTTSLTIVYLTVYSSADQRKHQSTASLAFLRGIHWSPVNSPHKWPVTQETFPFDDVIICLWQRRDASVSQDSVCFQSSISSHVRRVLAKQTFGWDHSHVTRDGKWTLADFANDGTAYILQAVLPLVKGQQWQIAVLRQDRYLIEEYQVCNITERTW